MTYVASLVAESVKNPPTMQETQVQFLSWEDPVEKGMQTTPEFLPRQSHGQRSLAGYSPWTQKESDTTEHTHITTLIHHHGITQHFTALKILCVPSIHLSFDSTPGSY